MAMLSLETLEGRRMLVNSDAIAVVHDSPPEGSMVRLIGDVSAFAVSASLAEIEDMVRGHQRESSNRPV